MIRGMNGDDLGGGDAGGWVVMPSEGVWWMIWRGSGG